MGIIAICGGVAAIKMYYDRHKNNIWGEFYQIMLEGNSIYDKDSFDKKRAKFLIYVGACAISVGVYILFYGVLWAAITGR